MSEELTCWSCNTRYAESLDLCPSCGEPKDRPTEAETSQSGEEISSELDFAIPDMDYVEGVTEESSTPKGEMDAGYQTESSDDLDFVIPDMNYVEGVTEESSTPKGQMDEGYQEESSDDLDFVIPDMDYVEGVKEESSTPKGEMDQVETSTGDLDFLDEISSTSEEGDDLSFLNEISAKNDETGSESGQSSMLADMDDLMSEPEKIQRDDFDFTLPDMEGITNLEFEEAEEELDEERVGPSRLRDLDRNRLLMLFVGNNIYWAIVMGLIVFATYEVVNPNFDPTILRPDDYTIHPLSFWMGWISFLVTGWFISYKIRSHRITPRFYHASLFIVIQFIMILILSQLALLIYNPELLSGIYSRPNYLISSYFLFIPDYYLTVFISGGIVMYSLGFKFLWNIIYEITPRSELEPHLADL